MAIIFKSKPALQLEKDLGISEGGRVQAKADELVRNNLMAYVSKDEGTQEQSIKIATVLGSGKVIINVTYAEYQAYSKKIKKRVGKRGTQPFERMKADKKDSIFRQLEKYSRMTDR